MAISNYRSGDFNNQSYWNNLNVSRIALSTGRLSEAIAQTFNSFDEFKQRFSDAGKTRLGNSCTWLCLDDKEGLVICTTSDKANKLMVTAEKRRIPLLALESVDNEYDLKNSDKRADYIDAFWKFLNWEEIDKRYENALNSSVAG